MKKLLLISIAVLSLTVAHGQAKDTIISDTTNLQKDKSSEIILSLCSPGLAGYTSSLNSKIKRNNFFANFFYVGIVINKITITGLVHSGTTTMKDTVTFQGKHWTKINPLFWGLNFSYAVIDSRRIKLKPYLGFTSSFFDYAYHINDSLKVQKSTTTACMVLGVNLEYRFSIKNIWTAKDDDGNIVWADRHWSIFLQSGIIPSVFKNNIGLKGDMIFATIGLSHDVGNYVNLKNKKQRYSLMKRSVIPDKK